MCIFQSEQVIKLRFWHKNVTSPIFKSYMHIYLLFTCVGHDAGTLSEIASKTDQHCRAEHCFAIDMEWFATGVHW